jgi:hypothetical protein
MSLAQQLFVGAVCASTLVEHLRLFLGWDTEATDRAVTMMDATWRRTARSKAGCSPTSGAADSPRGGVAQARRGMASQSPRSSGQASPTPRACSFAR